MPQRQKKNKKTKKLSFIFNRVIDDYKKKQKNNEKKEIKFIEDCKKNLRKIYIKKKKFV